MELIFVVEVMRFCTSNHSNQVLEAFLFLFFLGGGFVSTLEQYSRIA